MQVGSIQYAGWQLAVAGVFMTWNTRQSRARAGSNDVLYPLFGVSRVLWRNKRATVFFFMLY
jgi:hypothetical protein